MGIFLTGSVLCGTATSFGALIAFRALQGLGAGALQPMAMTIGADLYKLKERGRVQAVSTAAWGLANVVGPLMGGWIVGCASWRWVFLVNVPVGAVAVLLLAVSYRDPPRTVRAPLGAFGALLAGSSTALVSFAVSPDGLRTAAARFAVAIVAAASVALLVHHQARGKVPVLARSAAEQPEVRAGLAASFCLGAIIYSTSAYVPLWIIAQGRGSELAAGAALVPLLGGWALGSGTSVRWLVAYGMRAVVVAGFGLAVVGATVLAAVASVFASTYAVLGSLAILGLGLGHVAMASILAPQSKVLWADRASVTSTMFATRTLGGSIAVAALSAGGVGVHEGVRFAGIAVLAVVGLVTSAALAPRGLRMVAGEPVFLGGE